MYKISFFVPQEHADTVKKVMFDKGAGKIGPYEHCSWQCLGQGQFRPLKGSQAWQGEVGCLETIQELKVEMVCKDEIIKEVIAAMKQAHPYETPAYDIWKLADLS